MKRYKLKGNTLDVDDASMKGKLAYHFFTALHPGKNWDKATEDVKMIMKGLADIAYEEIEKHVVQTPPTPEPAPAPIPTPPAVANT